MKRALIILFCLLLISCNDTSNELNSVKSEVREKEITIEAPVYLGKYQYKEDEIGDLSLLFSYNNKLNLIVDGKKENNVNALSVGIHHIEAYVSNNVIKSESIVVELEVIEDKIENGSIVHLEQEVGYYIVNKEKNKQVEYISYSDINESSKIITDESKIFNSRSEHFDIDFYSLGYMVAVEWGFNGSYVNLLHIESGKIVELPYYFGNLHFNSDLSKVIVFERHFAPSYYEMDYSMHVFLLQEGELKSIDYNEVIDETAFEIIWIDDDVFQYSYLKDSNNEFMRISPLSVTETKQYDFSSRPISITISDDEYPEKHDSIEVLYNSLSLDAKKIDVDYGIMSSDFIDTISYENNTIWYWFEVVLDDDSSLYAKRQRLIDEEINFMNVQILTDNGIKEISGGRAINEDLIDINVILIYIDQFYSEGPTIKDWVYYSFNTNNDERFGYFDMDYPGTYIFSPNKKMLLHYYTEYDSELPMGTFFIHGVSGNIPKVLLAIDIDYQSSIDSFEWINDHALEINIIDNDATVLFEFDDGSWQISDEELFTVYEKNPFTVYINTEILNVRDGASIESNIVNKLSMNDQVQVLDSKISGERMWFMIGEGQWIDSQYTRNNKG